jgi:hypothetical protein
VGRDAAVVAREERAPGDGGVCSDQEVRQDGLPLASRAAVVGVGMRG